MKTKEPDVWWIWPCIGLLLLLCIGLAKFKERSAPKLPHVEARVMIIGDKVTVTNLSKTVTWPYCEVRVNPLGAGHRETIYRDVPPGETVAIGLRELTTQDGTRFNPFTTAPKEIMIKVPEMDSYYCQF